MPAPGSASWRLEEWGEPCEVEKIRMEIYPGGPWIDVHRDAEDAFHALGHVFLRHGYVVRRAGGFNCRKIAGSKSWSSHAWGLAVDFNDDTNPYRRDRLVTDFPRAMVRELTGIRTNDGVQVFRWGGDWDGRPDTPQSNYDSMHVEVVATPAELEAGIAGLDLPAEEGDEQSAIAYPIVGRGERGPVVVLLQKMLGMERTTGTGEFGPRTERAVKAYQRSRGLVEDGVVGWATWTALLSQQPALEPGDVPPQKHI